MKRPKIQRSQRLPAGLPGIALECAPAPRLIWLCVVPAVIVILSVLLAPAPALGWRAALAVLVGVSAVPAVRTVGGFSHEHRVRALLWDEQGRWWLTDDDAVVVAARLVNASVIGPFAFLAWKDAQRRLRRAVIDTATVQPAPGRALIGRLRTSRQSAGP